MVDTSAVLAALVGNEPAPELLDTLSRDGDLHAPHLIDIEFLHALRRLSLAHAISEGRAADARTDFAELTLVRYPHHELSDRIWALRHNVTAYDGAFVALAEVLTVPLVTCDARVASASGHGATIELFSA